MYDVLGDAAAHGQAAIDGACAYVRRHHKVVEVFECVGRNNLSREGAGIWDFQTNKFVWVKGYFPIRQALTPEAYEPHANYYEQIFS